MKEPTFFDCWMDFSNWTVGFTFMPRFQRLSLHLLPINVAFDWSDKGRVAQ